MMTITFDQITERVAAHAASEAASSTPLATAIRAVYILRSVLADLDPTDRARALAVLAEEIAAPVSA